MPEHPKLVAWVCSGTWACVKNHVPIEAEFFETDSDYYVRFRTASNNDRWQDVQDEEIVLV